MENTQKEKGGGWKIFLISFFTSIIFSLIATIIIHMVGILDLSSLFNKPVAVDDVRNANLDHARLILERKGLMVSVGGEEENTEIPKGNITKQEPLPGSMVKKGSSVIVTISKGIEAVDVPYLSMIPAEAAKNQITKIGLTVGQIKYSTSENVPSGSVISSDPQSGTKMDKGKPVNLLVSSGKNKVKVPNLIGMQINDVAPTLEAKGLRIGKIKKITDEKKNFDLIVNQSPASGGTVPAGSEVSVTVNAEEEGE